MHWSRAEIAAWVIAILGIVAMGVIVVAGPFHNINKTSASSFPLVKVKILSDPKTIGRYQPAIIHLHVGQSVTFTNVSNASHTVTDRSKSQAFDSGDIGTGGTKWTYVAQAAGAYPFICAYHPLMKGTLVVTA